MASSKLMSTSNPDPPIHNNSDPLKIANYGSMTMEDLLKNIYNDDQNSPENLNSGEGPTTAKHVGNKTVDEVWREIVEGGGNDSVQGGVGGSTVGMTLEDFLNKAVAAEREDEVGGYGVDAASMMMVDGEDQFRDYNNRNVVVDGSTSILGFGNGMDGNGRVMVSSNGGRVRGKRRAVEETVDKATQQKQKRMIKNRESAARSRERKQAYAVELESLVSQLEEENMRLRRAEADETRKRYILLMKNLIPVEEKEKEPPRILRPTKSL